MPWSAAFISWDIESAGVPRDLFCPDARHTIYVERMVERARRPGAAFVPHHLNERAPQVGDLLCASRDGGGTTLENLDRGPGHCDIVVEVRPGEVHAIGGNVANSVTRSVFPLDESGFLSPISGPAVLHRDREPTALGREMRLYDSYDYVIIGAGSAGSVIANRLGEDYRLRILIIEAGPPDTSFMLKMPAGFASLGEKSPYNWRYETTPQKHCNDRRMYWPRGKTLGGSSAINAMLYVRGNAWDYDHWRQLGNEGWSYDDVLPFFKKAENNERGGDDFHGTGGPLNVADQADPAPDQRSLREGRRAGRPQAGRRTSTAPRRRASASTRSRRRTRSAGAPPAPTCGPRSSATRTTSMSCRTRWSSASSSTRTTPWACATSSTAGTRWRAPSARSSCAAAR